VLAEWLRGLVGLSHMPDGGVNQLILPDHVRDALVEKRFLRQSAESLEVTDDGINAVWKYTFALKARAALS
jgi:hypothetical protein